RQQSTDFHRGVIPWRIRNASNGLRPSLDISHTGVVSDTGLQALAVRVQTPSMHFSLEGQAGLQTAAAPWLSIRLVVLLDMEAATKPTASRTIAKGPITGAGLVSSRALRSASVAARRKDWR